MDMIGYNENMWKAIIDMNGSRDIHNDIVILNKEMQLALWNIKNGYMTYNDLLIYLMHPENLEKIGTWINEYMDKHNQVQDGFIVGLCEFIHSLGYSDVYVKTTVQTIINDMYKYNE